MNELNEGGKNSSQPEGIQNGRTLKKLNLKRGGGGKSKWQEPSVNGNYYANTCKLVTFYIYTDRVSITFVLAAGKSLTIA